MLLIVSNSILTHYLTSNNSMFGPEMYDDFGKGLLVILLSAMLLCLGVGLGVGYLIGKYRARVSVIIEVKEDK